MKQNNFLKGTAVLIGANAVSKILGAVFKIPLTYILREEGMAIFNTALGVYSMILSFIISGIPLALSRFTAEEYALGNYSTVKRGIKVATVILCILGIIGSLVLYFMAGFFAYSMKDPKAELAIKVISPSIFFVAWGTVYKSFYQGCVNMIPTALSQVIEAFIKLAVGFLGAYLLRNAVIEITSAGAITGITVGEIIATLILFLMYIPSNKKLPYKGEIKRKRDICLSLASIAIPMLVCSCISGSLDLLDVSVVRNSLLRIRFTPETAEKFLLNYSAYTTNFDNLCETLKLSIDGARWIYGAYSGYALTIFHLPTGIIGALGVCVLPLISGALAKKDYGLAENTASLSLKLTLIIVLPSALMTFLFGEQLLDLLFHNTASAGLLKLLSPCMVFVCVAQLFTVILHASGRIAEPFFYSLIGMAVKLAADMFLIPNPKINISGAPLGATAAFFVIMILNTISIKRHLHIRLNLINSLLKPLLSTVVMGIIAHLLFNPLCIIFGKSSLALIITVSISMLTYFLVLTSTGCIQKKELKELHL